MSEKTYGVVTPDQLLSQSGLDFLQGIISNSTALIIAKDLDGRYILVNDRFCETFGLRREEVLGKTSHDIFPG